MLEPDSRAVLLDQLKPPPGYRLEAAVATTFTLSLQTALVPPLAFAAFAVRNTSDPVAVLEAVRSSTDRVDIFCQGGQIAVPRAYSDLMAFLEPMVHPVMPALPGYLFHPKVWFLHYRDDEAGSSRFRLLVSTRNLVDSSAWDLVVTLDGTPGKREKANRPLARFLRHLPRMAVTPLDAERVSRVEDLAAQAERVQWELPDDVHRIDFHAWGIPRLKPTADFTGYRHLVMSPFMDAAGLRHVAPSRRDLRIVSRAEALDLIDVSDLPTERPGDPARLLVLDPLAGLVDPEEDEPRTLPEVAAMPDDDAASARDVSATPAPQRHGLHAKVTIAERNNGEAHVFIGSPNATHAAYNGNVEFAVELTGRSVHLGVGTVLGKGPANVGARDIDTTQGGLSSVLQPYERGLTDTGDEERRHELAKTLRNLAAVRMTGHVVVDGERYRENIVSAGQLPRLPEGCTARASLLTAPGSSAVLEPAEHVDVTLGPVELAAVTPFVVLAVTDGGGMTLSSVIHVALRGDPPDRLNAILARQIDTPAKFLHFLRLLLALPGGSADWLIGNGSGVGGWGAAETAGVLESVTAALADGAHNLEAMDGLLDRLTSTEAGRRVIPEGFEALWEQVRLARLHLERLRQEADQ